MDSISVRGSSNKTYEFRIHPFPWLFQPAGAVYVVGKQSPSENGGIPLSVMFIGITEDLSREFINHPKAQVFESGGADSIWTLLSEDRIKRLSTYHDLTWLMGKTPRGPLKTKL